MRGGVIGADNYYCRKNRTKVIFIKKPKLTGIPRNTAVKRIFYNGRKTKRQCRIATNVKTAFINPFGHVCSYKIAYYNYKEEAKTAGYSYKVFEIKGGNNSICRKGQKPPLALKGKNPAPCLFVRNKTNSYSENNKHRKNVMHKNAYKGKIY